MFNVQIFNQILISICAVVQVSITSETLRKCCATGVRHAAQGSAVVAPTDSSCYKDVSNKISPTAKDPNLDAGCESMQKTCCLKAEMKQACIRGEAFSKPIFSSPCDKSPESVGVHASTYLSCCECCQMGKHAAKKKISTCRETPILASKCDGIYYRCCKSAFLAYNGPQTCGEAECSQTCSMTLNGPKCGCRSGFQLHEDNTTCTDVNECEIGTHNCKAGYSCLNVPGTYRCRKQHAQIKCPEGYKQQDSDCYDIDECELGLSNCPEDKFCENTLGSFQCVSEKSGQCEVGYFESMGKCVDKNECKLSKPCKDDEKCINLAGSYRCEQFKGLKCNRGYKSDGRTCRDINECKTGAHACSNNGEECVNLIGSYRCKCKTGYKRDTTSGQCKDVDECNIPGRRLCAQQCKNVIGSFHCSCYLGFKLQANGRTCTDINECRENTLPACPGSDNCFNARGSYICVAKDCPPNYIRQNSRICQRDCAYGEDCDEIPVYIRTGVKSRSRKSHFRMDYYINISNLHDVKSVNFVIEKGNEDKLFKMRKIQFSRILIYATKKTFLDRNPFHRRLKIVGTAHYGNKRKAIVVYELYLFFY